MLIRSSREDENYFSPVAHLFTGSRKELPCFHIRCKIQTKSNFLTFPRKAALTPEFLSAICIFLTYEFAVEHKAGIPLQSRTKEDRWGKHA